MWVEFEFEELEVLVPLELIVPEGVAVAAGVQTAGDQIYDWVKSQFECWVG
jgi:hypothetical protein